MQISPIGIPERIEAVRLILPKRLDQTKGLKRASFFLFNEVDISYWRDDLNRSNYPVEGVSFRSQSRPYTIELCRLPTAIEHIIEWNEHLTRHGSDNTSDIVSDDWTLDMLRNQYQVTESGYGLRLSSKRGSVRVFLERALLSSNCL